MAPPKYITYVRSFSAQHRATPAELRAAIERSQAEGRVEELEAAALLVHRVHGTARMLGLSSLGLLAGALERSIDSLRRRSARAAAPEWQMLLSATDELDRLMLELREHEHEVSASRELLAALEALARG